MYMESQNKASIWKITIKHTNKLWAAHKHVSGCKTDSHKRISLFIAAVALCGRHSRTKTCASLVFLYSVAFFSAWLLAEITFVVVRSVPSKHLGKKEKKKWKFPPVTHSNDTKCLFFFIIVTTKTNITFIFLYAALISPISFKLYETSEIKHTRKKLERVWRVDLYKGINTVACFFKWYYLSEELHNAFFPLILRRVTQSQNISEHLKKSIS